MKSPQIRNKAADGSVRAAEDAAVLTPETEREEKEDG